MLVVFAVVGWAAAAGMEFIMLAFTDYCPPDRCNANAAATSVLLSVSAAAVLTVVGTVATIVCLVRRRLAWPFAVAALILPAAAELLGIVGYFVAVGD
ncbi:hypothetical protein [Mycobacterium shigaense]|uniref:Uncharacterized protein n=1 Tax=Mycobacterium shigaense TaxID=722731 RepID=A0A1Z4EFD3_9MYCO|nr:hypothetical protein [Mycobacterium shigaense]MEA1124772.1 hypothetical protein [Mycobacterium shigaense]BAX91681.1 hypothetical protein MSG_01525 [Mycobacterium shigaense]